MAPTKSSLKKSTKAPTTKAAKAVVEPTPVAAVAESSTKPSKTLKRKKAEPEAVVAEEPEAPKSSKKAKKEPKAAAAKPAAPAVVEAEAPVVAEAAVVEDKPKKTKGKVAKDVKAAPAPAASEPEAAPPAKKSKALTKAAEPAPTSISRPRNTEKSTKASKSKKSKAKSPSPVVEDAAAVVEEDAEAAAASDDEEGALLHGFSTDDDDSSDEEDVDMDVEVDMGKLPTIAKDDATVKWKLEKAKQNPGEDRGVLFLGRLPHGFYEEQLKAYFSQFGNVTRLRVSRNKRTGKSKHYGFIEFDSSAVAKIVADTMDNYLLMGHIMRAKLIPKDDVHPELWVGANRKWRVVPKERVAREEHDRPRTDAEQARATKRLLKRQEERKAKLAKAGIDYDFDAVAYKTPVAV